MKLIVGLGNPGRKYDRTRHNIGYQVVAELAKKWPSEPPRAKFQGAYVEAVVGAEKVGLLAPETYMNASGQSVRQAMDFFKLPHESLLVICDDLNLPLAKLRIRPGGSAGGQKGLADIIRVLGSEKFPRLRVGIGQAPPGWDVADYVLSRFSEAEHVEVEIAVKRAADAIDLWVQQGIEPCMNLYNRG